MLRVDYRLDIKLRVNIQSLAEYREAYAAVLAYADGDVEVAPEGVQPLRVLADPWSSPPARRVILNKAIRRLAPSKVPWVEARHLTSVILSAWPIAASGEVETDRNLHWALTTGQDHLDAWRDQHPEAAAFLQAAVSWICDGQPPSLCFGPLVSLYDVIKYAERTLSELRAVVWFERFHNEKTLEDVGIHIAKSRERVRQIEGDAVGVVAIRLSEMLRHPFYGLLIRHHLDAIGLRLVSAASEAEGRLTKNRISHWADEILERSDAKVAKLFLKLQDEVSGDVADVLDWFSRSGHPLRGGRTSQPVSDREVAAIVDAFAEATGGGRYGSIQALADITQIELEKIRALLPFAGLTAQGDIVIPGSVRATDRRVVRAIELLAQSDRPLHAAEIFAGGLVDNPDESWTYGGLVNALGDVPSMVATDEFGVFDLLTRCPSKQVIDRRSPAPAAEISVDGPPWSGCASFDPSAWPAPSELAFPAAVASTLRHRRSMLPGDRRVSICELLMVDEAAALRDWFSIADPTGSDTETAGITLLAAYWAICRVTAFGGREAWGALSAIAGEAMRSFIWSSTMPRSQAIEAIIRAIHALHLRHSFSCGDNIWITTLRLQAGFQHGDIAYLRDWIADPDRMPPALRMLSVDPDSGISRLLGGLTEVAMGERDAASFCKKVEHLPWWPGWNAETLVAALDRPPLSHRAFRRRLDDDADREDLLATPTEQLSASVDQTQSHNITSIPGLRLHLGRGASSVRMPLPDVLHISPGPVTLVCGGARVGGSVSEGGQATWFTSDGYITLPLRGNRVRTVEIQREGVLLATSAVELWHADESLLVFDLRADQPIGLNPIQSRISPTGPHAVLFHDSLNFSIEPDDEGPLDDEHRLAIYRTGLPAGLTVSCLGEVVWQYEPPEASRMVVSIPGATLLADASDANWGDACSLRMVAIPDDFIPTKAVVAGQTLRVIPDGLEGRRSIPGYRVLPGSSPLSRQGRIEGKLKGQPVSIPIEVVVTRPPRGAALHDGDAWTPLTDNMHLDRSRHAHHRLWVNRPKDTPGPWVVFEGARPAVAFGQNGPLIGRALLGLGERVVVAPGTFNQTEGRIDIATSIDTGILLECVSTEPGSIRVVVAIPLAVDNPPQAFGWSRDGIFPLTIDADPAGYVLTLRGAPGRLDGIALFAEDTWLGSGYLSPPSIATWNLLGSPDQSAAFSFAKRASMPLLDAKVQDGVRRLIARQPLPFVPLLLENSTAPKDQHLASTILAAWSCPSDVATTLIEEYRQSRAVEHGPSSKLESLAALAPIALVRLLAAGWSCIGRAERVPTLTALALAGVPNATIAKLAARSALNSLPEVEAALLHDAVSATRCDAQFLASRAESSISSVAWSYLKGPAQAPVPNNLMTALSLPSLRHWLTAALLMRLLAEAR